LILPKLLSPAFTAEISKKKALKQQKQTNETVERVSSRREKDGRDNSREKRYISAQAERYSH